MRVHHRAWVNWDTTWLLFSVSSVVLLLLFILYLIFLCFMFGFCCCCCSCSCSCCSWLHSLICYNIYCRLFIFVFYLYSICWLNTTQSVDWLFRKQFNFWHCLFSKEWKLMKNKKKLKKLVEMVPYFTLAPCQVQKWFVVWLYIILHFIKSLIIMLKSMLCFLLCCFCW